MKLPSSYDHIVSISESASEGFFRMFPLLEKSDGHRESSQICCIGKYKFDVLFVGVDWKGTPFSTH